MQALRRLRAFARGASSHGRAACGHALSDNNAHLYHPARRQIRCCCPVCRLAPEAGWLQVPSQISRVSAELDDGIWQSLGIPVALASFVRRDYSEFVSANSEGAVSAAPHALRSRATYWSAAYPGPAGLIETALSDAAVESLLQRNPEWTDITPHVEAIVVNRLGPEACAFRVPIDVHFRLAGELRTHWRGLSGGDEVWHRLEQFFLSLEQHA